MSNGLSREINKNFIQIPMLKLILLSTFTFGLYNWCWVHRNWKIHQTRTTKKINIPLRTIFFVFFSYPLFKEIYNSKAKGVLMFMLFLSITLSITAIGILTEHNPLLHNATFFIFLFANIFYFVSQHKINSIPDPAQYSQKYYRFNTANMLGIIIGGILLCFVVLGMPFEINFEKEDLAITYVQNGQFSKAKPVFESISKSTFATEQMRKAALDNLKYMHQKEGQSQL